VREVFGLEIWGRGDGERGELFREEQAVGEITEAAQVVNGEGEEGNVVGVDGVDDGGVGDGAVGASRQF
jgi:hypothetical protein